MENAEKIKESCRLYQEENAEKIKAYKKQYKLDNAEKLTEKNKWRKSRSTITKYSQNKSLLIGCPDSLILSVTDVKWGEVNRPVLMLCCLRMASV